MASLPTQRRKPSAIDPNKLNILLIGEPKIGKTSWIASDPNVLFLAFERGHNFIEANIFDVLVWDYSKRFKKKPVKSTASEGSALEALELLEATPATKFPRIAIDTGDAMSKMISDWWCKENGYEDLSEAEWGKGWEAGLAKPMREYASRIQATGRSITWATHSKSEIQKFSKVEKTYKETTLPKGAAKVIVPAVDMMMHMEAGARNSEGEVDRVMVTSSDPDALAGNRMSDRMFLPQRYITSKTNGWNQFCKLIKDEEFAKKTLRIYNSRYRK